MGSQPLSVWAPSEQRRTQTQMYEFAKANSYLGADSQVDYEAMHLWSVDNPEDFWARVWDYCGVVGERGERAFVDGPVMWPRDFFPMPN